MSIEQRPEDLFVILPEIVSGELSKAWFYVPRPSGTQLVGAGSANIPLMLLVYHLAILLHKGKNLTKDETDYLYYFTNLAVDYFNGPWWATEPGSRFVYGWWIDICIRYLFMLSVKFNLPFKEQARASVAASDTFRALGSGWRKDIQGKEWPGYPTTITGSRSCISMERNVGRFKYRVDEAGKPLEIYCLYDQMQDALQMSVIGSSTVDPFHAKVKRAAMRLGVQWPLALSNVERSWLKRMVTTRAYTKPLDNTTLPVVTRAVSLLDRTPGPKVPFLVGRTEGGAFTLNLQTTNAGSTAPLEYVAWHMDHTKAPSRALPWFKVTKGIEWQSTNSPAYRGKGVRSKATVQGKRVTIKRDDNMHYNWASHNDVPGPITFYLPEGNVIWIVKWDKNGATLYTSYENLEIK